MNKPANSIIVTRSRNDEKFKYSMRIEYDTRIVTMEVQDEDNLIANIKGHLFGPNPCDNSIMLKKPE